MVDSIVKRLYNVIYTTLYQLAQRKIMDIDPNSPIPLYLQIKEVLIKDIQAGVYPTGTRLPSERELASLYNVSRMTARTALQALTQEGVIFSQTGKGNYVRKPKINQQLGILSSFTEEMQQRGMTASSRLITAEIIPASPYIAQELQVPIKAEIVFLQRIRLANDVPIALESTYLVHELCPNILEAHDFSKESLYKVLREVYSCPLNWARQSIQACLPNAAEQKLLDISPNTPVLSNTRTVFTRQDKPIEFVNSIYNGEMYDLKVILH